VSLYVIMITQAFLVTQFEYSAAFAYTNTSISIAKMVKMGLNAHIGAHGEAPLGLNYHAEMFFARQGGLNNFEVGFIPSPPHLVSYQI
jgi:hypothetical protein